MSDIEYSDITNDIIKSFDSNWKNSLLFTPWQFTQIFDSCTITYLITFADNFIVVSDDFSISVTACEYKLENSFLDSFNLLLTNSRICPV